MAIVPLVKVTLYGPAAEKDGVLDGLQRLGCLHLVDLNPSAAPDRVAQPSAAEARAALRWLEDSPRRRRPRRTADFDPLAVAREAHEIRERARALDEERQQLGARIADLEPWGEFELPGWAREGELRFWFHLVPLYQLELLNAVAAPWTIVGKDHRFARVVAVAAEAPAGMPGTPAALDARRLSALRARLEEVEVALEELEDRRVGLTRHVEALRSALDETEDRVARERAGRTTLDRDELFAVQGWAPAERMGALRRFAAERRLASTVQPAGPGDAPPTLLDNPAALRAGESLVTFYKTPGYRMWDPSRAVFVGFAVFFGMILSDAAYGLLLGIATLVFWKRLGRSSGARGLAVALVLSCVIWGALVGSWFGWIPPPGSALAKVHLLDVEDQGLMMLISTGVGVVHLAFANLVTAWRRRRSLALFGPLGWAAVLLGGFGAALAREHPETARLGLGAVAGGLALVLLFSSEHPFSFAPRALVARFMEGLKSLTEISKVFGDVLSYLRLFALGLAAIKLAEAFNTLAASAFELRPGGVLLGATVLLVGHLINLTMGIMGGVVHGLRLNVIEFFNWSLPEEGAEYRAFSKKAA
jgi:V/A-type H+-transporting ATPase subunit I